MRGFRTACWMILAAGLLVPGILRAEGSSEEERPSAGASGEPTTQATVQAYWILEAGAANAELLLERLYFPTSLSVLRWTEFRVTSGGVELASSGGYRVARKEPLLTEAWEGRVLHGYTIRISFTGQGDEPSRAARRMTVTFAYDTGGGAAKTAGGDAAKIAGVVPQPLQQALLKGIEASGKKNGLARVLELQYKGKGRFQARVEVQ